MKKLLNTLYITDDKAYLALDGENIVISSPEKPEARFPLCNLEEVVCFSYLGCSPALMGKCCQNNISLTFLTPEGRFLARVTGEVKGNVFTRVSQLQKFSDDSKLELIRSVLAAKFLNTKFLLSRSVRDYSEIDCDGKVSSLISKITQTVSIIESLGEEDALRGIEGDIAKDYFAIFSRLIRNKNVCFRGRSRRPPLDEVNAVLSFLYTLMGNSIAASLERCGIDPYIGFFHTLRPGRVSLALDILEEFRAVIDRFVIGLFNLKQLDNSDFIKMSDGAVILNDNGRIKVLKLWQDKKRETIKHPFLEEKIPFGLLPFVQSSLLAGFLRGDRQDYYPFVCR